MPRLLSPALGCGKAPPSRCLLLMEADVVRLSQVILAGLAARDPIYHLPLQGLVSPQNVELSAYTKGSSKDTVKQGMVQNAFGRVHKSLHTTCPKITHGVRILAPGGSRGHSKDSTVTLVNKPSASALRGAVATVGGGLASAIKPRLRLRQGPPLRDAALDGGGCPQALTNHSCRPCRQRHNLSSPSMGPSVSTKRGNVGISEGLYSAENGAKCIRTCVKESPHSMS